MPGPLSSHPCTLLPCTLPAKLAVTRNPATRLYARPPQLPKRAPYNPAAALLLRLTNNCPAARPRGRIEGGSREDYGEMPGGPFLTLHLTRQV